jgi:hypothetical protein
MRLSLPFVKPEKHFWDWFIRHEPELFALRVEQPDAREKIFREIALRLRKVDRDLVFEFGPNKPKREFVISAGGIKRAFPAVASLVDSAPTLDRWRITAFRPRRTPVSIVEFNGKRVDPKDVQFTLISDGTIAGIRLFIPGRPETDTDLRQIGYLLLDEALGEYDVESHIGPIEMLPAESHTDAQRYSFAELPNKFDELVGSLQGGTRLNA